MRGAAENTGARAAPGASSANTHLRVEAAARRAGSAACTILSMEFVLSLFSFVAIVDFTENAD